MLWGEVVDTINFKYVLEVYRTKNITEAAKNLYISQPALSQAIKRIEKNYNIRLFEKDYSLTRSGEVFVHYASEICNSLNSLEKKLNSRELNIGISQFYGKYLLNDILIAISKIDPEIKVHIKEDISTILEEEVLKGNLDVCFIPEPIFNKLKTKVLFEEKLVLGFPENLEIENLAEDKHNILSIAKGHKLRELSDEIFKKFSIKSKDVFEATNLDTLNSLILTKNAVAVLPQIVERLRGVKYVETSFKRNFHMVYKNSSKIDINSFFENYKLLSSK